MVKLAHINALVGDGGGGAHFDEGKIKRDKNGKFSKKDVTALSDALWENGLDSIQLYIMEHTTEAIKALTIQLAKEHGVPVDKVQTQDWYVKPVVDVLNESAKTMGVSPSGTQRIGFSFNDKTKQLEHKPVPFSGPNPHPTTTQIVNKQSRDTLNSRESGDDGGMRFNPKATLDRSQIKVLHTDGKEGGTMSVLLGIEAVEKVLKHHGVKGMRWGVRKDDGASSSSVRRVLGFKKAKTAVEPVKLSEDHVKAAVARSKHPSELNNDELKGLIDRMNLEQQYSKLVAKPSAPIPVKNQSSLTKGRKFVTSLLTDIARSQAQRVARSAADVLVEDRLTGTQRHQSDLMKEVGSRIVPKEVQKARNEQLKRALKESEKS